MHQPRAAYPRRHGNQNHLTAAAFLVISLFAAGVSATAPATASGIEPAPENTTPQPQPTTPSKAAATPPAGLIVTFKQPPRTSKKGTPKNSQPSQNQLQTLADALPVNTSIRPMSLGKVAVPTSKASYSRVKKTLQTMPGVRIVEPDSRVWSVNDSAHRTTSLVHHTVTPTAKKRTNDPLRSKQWALDPQRGGLGAPLGQPTKAVTVAVIDTGSIDHPELNSVWLPGADLISIPAEARDGNGRDLNARDEGDFRSANDCLGLSRNHSTWHGAHVAGIIGAAHNNGIGISGAAPGVRIVPVRVLGRCGGWTSDIADSIVWAAGGKVPGLAVNKNPAKVINLSLGGFSPCRTVTQDAINYARSRGAAVVVAAGNAMTDSSHFSPANCRGTITVAATDRRRNLAFYSNYGTKVDVAAPGGLFGSDEGVLSTVLKSRTRPRGNPTYKAMPGTSMAAPHVSALAAHLFAANPKLTPAAIERILTNTADPYQDTQCKRCRGGIVNPAKAVAAAKRGGSYRNILPHGTFENGRNSWFELRPGTITNKRSVKPYRGKYAAILGSRGAANTSLISTRVTIPASAQDAYLTYHFRVDSFDSRTVTKDTMKVSVNGYHLLTHTNKARRGKYRSLRVDLREYIGKTVTLSFDAREDEARYTRFTVDNVRLMVK